MKKITLGLFLGCAFLATANYSNATGVNPVKPKKATAAPFAAVNDNCGSAIAITTLPYSNTQTDGVDAENDGFVMVCVENENYMNDGLWYTVEGTGSTISVKVTPADEDYDVEVGVFSGSCDALECVGTSDSNGSGILEVFSFQSQEGVTYYINVGNYSGTVDNPEVNFTIEVGSFEVPANDNCDGAIEITSFPYSNEQTDGVAATADGLVEACVDYEMNDGLWYTVVGNGNDLEITVTTGEEYDIAIGVYTGDCGAFNCVEVVDEASSGEEFLVIPSSEVGTVYYINVGNYDWFDDLSEGNFTIVVDSVVPTEPAPVPENDACDTATVITTFPFTDNIDATSATNNDGTIVVTECGSLNDGIWYTVEGNGNDIVVSATSLGWDGELAIYTGSCGDFTCYDSVDSQEEDAAEVLTITASEIGTVYYINFGHYDGFDDEAEGQAIIEVTSEDLSVGGNELKNFTAYPNPVRDILNLSHFEAISTVEVFNLLGQKMLAKSIDTTQGQLDMSKLSSGSYLVKVTSGAETKTMKVLKQ